MKRMKTIRVTHPLYGTCKAENVRDNLQAVQAAAKEWRLQAGACQKETREQLQWSAIARDCSFEEVEEDGCADLDAP